MSDATIALLKELIAIDSVNPSLVPGGAGEAQIVQHIAQELRSFGADTVIQEASPGRPNVIGILDRGNGRSLMLCGHSDTVGVEGMARPLDPVERDGKIFGRGSQDMKGGVASILGAARRLADSLRRGKLVVAIVADEEYASVGAEAVVKEATADAAIVCEPTDLVVGIGHKGFEWVDVTTVGVAAHGSRPDDGVDAIALMGRVLAGIEELEKSFIAGARHPVLGLPSVHASLIEGGRELSTYPDRCKLSIERRTVAGEGHGVLGREVDALLTELRIDPRFQASSRVTFHRSPYLTPENHPLVSLFGNREKTALSFWTDAAILGAAGIASVVFGPGGAGLHSVEEYVRIADVLDCRDALVDVALRFCHDAD
jgi:acetylornithine deacetylase